MSEKKIKIFEGDCLKVMKKMEDCSYTSILSDVPYGLSFMGKKWDYDVPSVEVFEEMLRVTQHGGYLFCFGGSRTFHRIACNIEDAGWVLKDTIMWLYGSGFPKSHNISKAIDKKYGLEIEKVSEKKTSGKERNSMASKFEGEYYETKSNHNLAKDFEGYGTALKPAYEPIIIAHKPCEGSYVDNVEKHGIAGLNIEDCRVGNADTRSKTSLSALGQNSGWNNHKNRVVMAGSSNGRFPANVITDGSEEVCNVMDEQSGISKSSGGRIGNAQGVYANQGRTGWSTDHKKGQSGLGDVGGASRFFYCAKASQKEKNEGLERLQPQQRDSSRNEDQPSMNGGKGNPYNRGAKKVKNPHPTVKPIALMEYLAKMLTQPNGRTKILDPYMGSGTTLIACKKLGNIECHGIEMNLEYVKVAKARLGEDLSEYDVFDNTKENKKTNKQMTIWDILNEQ